MRKLLCFLVLAACHSPTEPRVLRTCEPVYMPVITPTDTLWYKTDQLHCTEVDLNTGKGRAVP